MVCLQTVGHLKNQIGGTVLDGMGGYDTIFYKGK